MTRSNRKNAIRVSVLAAMLLATAVLSERAKAGDLLSEGKRGEIIISVEAENPGPAGSTRTVRYYLPFEIMPEHIIDPAGLKIGGDPLKGGLYLEAESVFDAREVKRFNIKVEDVWRVSIPEIERYVREAEDIYSSFQGAPQEGIAQALYALIRDRSIEITSSQGKAGSVQEHIAVFRENEKKLREIWLSMDRLREMRDAGSPRARRRLDKEQIETILLMVTTFAFLVAGASFFVWSSGFHRGAGAKGAGRSSGKGRQTSD